MEPIQLFAVSREIQVVSRPLLNRQQLVLPFSGLYPVTISHENNFVIQ